MSELRKPSPRDLNQFIEPQNEVAYDRTEASQILLRLGRVAIPDDLSPFITDIPPISYKDEPMKLVPGSHMTKQQDKYFSTYMAPEAHSGLITSATNYIFWNDSDGVINVGFYKDGENSLGPVVPIAARETMLVLTHSLQNPNFQSAVANLSEEERAVLEGTTTDKTPEAIMRVGFDSAAKAVVQHALIADETPFRTPQAFVRGMLDSGLFRAVATNYYWELQASTNKRKMVTGHLETTPNGRVRFTGETMQAFRGMKERTIFDAKAIAHKAVVDEGLDMGEAVSKYHGQLDEAAEQYMRLPNGEHPYCLGMMPHRLPDSDKRETAFDYVGERFVATFEQVMDRLTIYQQIAEENK